MVYFSDLRFGFEFETLMNAIHLDLRTTDTKLNKIQQALSECVDICQDTNVEVSKCPQDYNEQDFNFKVISDKDENDTKDKKPFWAITLDSSVELRPELNYLCVHPYFYYNLKDTMDDDKHATLRKNSNNSIIEHLEIVSPILKYDQIHIVKSAVKLFNGQWPCYEKPQWECFNNHTTSHHIHYSINESSKNPVCVFRDYKTLFKICSYWLYFEPLFLQLVPFWRNSNKYCKSMFDYIAKKHACDPGKPCNSLIEFMKDMKFDNIKNGNTSVEEVIKLFQGVSRYSAMNMMNIYNNTINTIEVRLKHGSNDGLELAQYICFFAFFFIACCNVDKFAYEINEKLPNLQTIALKSRIHDPKEYINLLFIQFFKFVNLYCVSSDVSHETKVQIESSINSTKIYMKHQLEIILPKYTTFPKQYNYGNDSDSDDDDEHYNGGNLNLEKVKNDTKCRRISLLNY